MLGKTVEAVRSAHDCDIIAYNAIVDRERFLKVLDLVSKHRERSNVLLLLTTAGGDPHAAYRIARLLRQKYKEFRLLIQGPCKSAGTLIAIGAHELVLSDGGELGPLDVQVQKRDELLESESGLDVMQSLDHLTGQALDSFRNCFLDVVRGSGLSSKLCAEIASSLVTELFGNIFAQVDPIRLGAVARANNIAIHYGSIIGQNLKKDALTKLVMGYPAHGAVIDREEACKLFNRVREPDAVEDALLSAIGSGFLVPSILEPLCVMLPMPKKGDASDAYEDGAEAAQAASGSRTTEQGGSIPAGPSGAGGEDGDHRQPRGDGASPAAGSSGSGGGGVATA